MDECNSFSEKNIIKIISAIFDKYFKKTIELLFVEKAVHAIIKCKHYGHFMAQQKAV